MIVRQPHVGLEHSPTQPTKYARSWHQPTLDDNEIIVAWSLPGPWPVWVEYAGEVRQVFWREDARRGDQECCCGNEHQKEANYVAWRPIRKLTIGENSADDNGEVG